MIHSSGPPPYNESPPSYDAVVAPTPAAVPTAPQASAPQVRLILQVTSELHNIKLKELEDRLFVKLAGHVTLVYIFTVVTIPEVSRQYRWSISKWNRTEKRFILIDC